MTTSPSTAAAVPLAIQALLAGLEKRGVMDQTNRDRLRRRLMRIEARSVGEIRRFLTHGGVKPAVAAVLGKVLPPTDDQRIGPCRILAHLADGGMGAAWLAEHQGRLAVVKTLKPAYAEDAEYFRRFEREARITATLDHPNLVRCLDHGLDMSGAYLVLEYVAGGDVGNLLKRSGRIPEGEALSILHQTVRGLDQAWQRSLIHRDIKPANLFIDDLGQIKVADFGLARSTAAETSVLTVQGTTVGSPAYMSPEQIRAGSLDWRADAYACGCVLFALLAGQPPFAGSISEVFAKHLTQPPPTLAERAPGCSPASGEIVRKCLAKKPDDRFRSAAELLDALQRALRAQGGDPEATLSQALVAGSTAAIPAADRVAQPPAGAIDGNRDALTPTASGSDLYGPGRAVAGPRSGALEPVADAIPEEGDDEVPPAASDADTDAATRISPSGRGRSEPIPPAGLPLGTLGNDADSHRFHGDWAAAIAGERLTISAGSGHTLILLAQASAVLGKQAGPPVDIALRDYPVSACATSCGRVSRQHLRLGLVDGGLQVTDLGSTNGTTVDQRMLEARETAILAGREHAIAVPDSVELRVRAIPKRTRAVAAIHGLPAAAADDAPGLASGAAVDAVLITRPANRPELAYALVLRRILIGSEVADLPIPGWLGESLEVSRWNGRWIGRIGRDVWSPVAQALGDRGQAIAGRHEDLDA